MPFVGIPFLPTNATRTKIKPFSFEERNKRLLALKEEKIRKFINAEKKVRRMIFNRNISVNCMFLWHLGFYLRIERMLLS